MTASLAHNRISEKLKILNDHATGITTRIYNIKKACADPKSKPAFLSDRSIENAIKHISKRFPAVDIRSSSTAVQQVDRIKTDVLKSLQLYYYTFVDLLELRDAVNDLLTTIDAVQLSFDVTLNTDLTLHYLDLVAAYVSLMILLSRVDDRRTVLGLYNAAHELEKGQAEPSFPRLAQMIVDYEAPLRRLSDEFIPHQRALAQALASIAAVYGRRNQSAEQWRQMQMLSVSAEPAKLQHVLMTETTALEYISLERIDRWIVLCSLVAHGVLAEKICNELWLQALQTSLVTQIFRDEVVATHQYAQSFFEGIKDKTYSKRVAEIKDAFTTAASTSALRHRERRKYLRAALKELLLLLQDEPGLLGPKALLVWTGLSLARDEITWLARHVDHWPLPASAKVKGHSDEFLIDRQLPELLHYMEELRTLIDKYALVIQRYYSQYIAGFDAFNIKDHVQALGQVPEEENLLLSSICQAAEAATSGVDVTEMEFRGLRMDWCRLQVYMSAGRFASHHGSLRLAEHRKLVIACNALTYKSKMIDFLDQLLVETSDLSILCFYSNRFDEWFHSCLKTPTQCRFACSFAQLSAHFPVALHQICPEERQHIGERSLETCNLVLEEICKEIKQVLTSAAEFRCTLGDRLLPKNCARLILQADERQKAAQKSKKQEKLPKPQLPGDESQRVNRAEVTQLDALVTKLFDLVVSIDNVPYIELWSHTFAPREYLTQHLETRFNNSIRSMVMYDNAQGVIAKPSELLSSLRELMSLMQQIEQCSHVDVVRVFNSVLLQQTQPLDSSGEDTLTSLYTKWYLEVLLRRVSAGKILYSQHQGAFIRQPSKLLDASALHNPQEYTDIMELRALCELLGPYGVKFLCERLTWHVASQINELKKIVQRHRGLLQEMRSAFDHPSRMADLIAQLQAEAASDNTGAVANSNKAAGGGQSSLDACESFLQRLTIIGEILSFRDLVNDALRRTLEDRTPFLLHSADSFRQFLGPHILTKHAESDALCELFAALGLETPYDASLCAAIRAQRAQALTAAGNESGEALQARAKLMLQGEEEYQQSCLLIVAIAAFLPRIARIESAFHQASLDCHLNNMHCTPRAIVDLISALFQLHARGDVVERMKEFLALASSNLLRLGMTQQRAHSPTPGAPVMSGIDRAQYVNVESTYILLDKLVQMSPWLTADLLESCFPYVLLRSSYHCVYKQEEFATQTLPVIGAAK